MREKAEKNYFAERGISSMSRNLFKSQESYRRTAMSEKGAEQLLKIRAIVSKLLCGPEPLLETRLVRGSKITQHPVARAKIQARSPVRTIIFKSHPLFPQR